MLLSMFDGIFLFSDKSCCGLSKNIQKYLYFNDWFQSLQLPTVHRLKRGNSAEKLLKLFLKYNSIESKISNFKYFIVNPFC